MNGREEKKDIHWISDYKSKRGIEIDSKLEEDIWEQIWVERVMKRDKERKWEADRLRESDRKRG